MLALETKSLSLGYEKNVVIDKLNLKIPKGKITVFVGANGCGKSTLLRSLAKLLKEKDGKILVNDIDIKKLARKEFARKIAILPQGPIAPDGLTVFQLVKQGRYPYQSWLQQWSKEDECIVNKALKSTGIEKLADKHVNSLSGGQRQRVWVAMVLAQNTDIILLDEPTTYLDLTHQIEILDLLFELNEDENRTIVMVLHDLNLACRYAHNIVALHNKSIHSEGTPESVVTSSMVKEVFNMSCDIISDPIFNTPLCVPHGKGRQI